MRGFGLFLGTILMMAASPAYAGNAQGQQKPTAQNPCPLVKTVQINVTPVTEDVKLDTSKTLDQIQRTDMDTINPYSFSGVTRIDGYMDATVTMRPEVKVGSVYNPKIGAFCLWYETINVRLEISPTIVIGKEIYQDLCLRKATVDHEMKHVQVDRKIVNKYAKIMGQKIYAAIKERGFRAEPVPKDYAQDMADRMSTVIAQILEHEHNKMQIERLELQRAVDSLQEYERVSALCPRERARLPQWASSTSKNTPGKPRHND